MREKSYCSYFIQHLISTDFSLAVKMNNISSWFEKEVPIREKNAVMLGELELEKVFFVLPLVLGRREKTQIGQGKVNSSSFPVIT